MARIVAALIIAAAVAAGSGAPARAQNASGIVVHVHAISSGAPVRDALVRLVGSSAQHTYVGRTNDGGDASFSGSRCESGLLLVEATGYDAFRQRVACDVAGVLIDVPLQPALTTIGHTRSTSPQAGRATVSLTPDTAFRRVSPNLVEALDQLAGLSSREQGIGFSAGVRGQDPAMTEYSLNGAPLGAGAASLAINSDLLSSASVDEANDAVALFSASPTGTPHYSSEIRLGNCDATFQKYQASGTFHGDGLGYVLIHTSRGLASALDEKTYRDASGLEYEHRGLRHTVGNLVRLTDAVGATSISFTSSTSTLNAQHIPAWYSGALPAGDGPGTHEDQISSNPVLFVSAPLRAGQLSLSAAHWAFSSWTDASARVVALVAAPQTGFARTNGTDLTFSLAGAPSRNRSFNASFSETTTSSSTVSNATVSGLSFGGAFATSTRTAESSFSENWHSNPRIPFGISLKHRNSERLGGALELGLTAQYIVSPRARLRYSGTFGTKLVDLASSQTSQIVADPASAEFDCANGAAFLTGPGAVGTKTRAANHDLSASLNGSRSNVTVAVYEHAYANASIGAVPLVAASLPADYFPPGYLATVSQQYRSASGCAGAIVPDRIYVQAAFAGANVVYRGASANGHLGLSRTLSADASLGIERARVVSGDPRLAATPFFPGSFVPGVPTYKGSLALAWQPSGTTTALLSTTLAGPHNARQLPAYAVVNAALERRLSPSSSAALLVTNLFDTLTDPFVSTKLAVPLRDSYGRLIPTFASPLLPRRVEFHYSVQLGNGGLVR